MEPLTFAKLRELDVKRCEEVFFKLTDWTPADWMTAIAGEVGEAANEIKKHKRDDQYLDAGRKKNIGKELADIVIYVDLLAARMGIDLEEEIREKFNEVSIKRGSIYRL